MEREARFCKGCCVRVGVSRLCFDCLLPLIFYAAGFLPSFRKRQKNPRETSRATKKRTRRHQGSQTATHEPPKRPPWGTKGLPRDTQRTPKDARRTPKDHLEAPRGAQETPKAPQGAPGGQQEIPQSTPEAPQKAPKRVKKRSQEHVWNEGPFI